jgi:uncharacterized protein
LQFTRDERKNRINQRKHGISFETAALARDHPRQVSRLDREVDGEQRWQTIGMVRSIQVLLVAHTGTESGGEEVVHIISTQKAAPLERRIYAQGD